MENPLTLIQWLAERHQNCLRLAKTKTRDERLRWLEDASYFARAQQAVSQLAERDKQAAAAPDLLAALKEAALTIKALHREPGWDIYERCSPEMKQIRAAIEKAEGKLPAHPEDTEPSSQDPPTTETEIERLKTELNAKEAARAQWADTAVRLRQALNRYAQHSENCVVNSVRADLQHLIEAEQCNCGLYAALGETASQHSENCNVNRLRTNEPAHARHPEPPATTKGRA